MSPNLSHPHNPTGTDHLRRLLADHPAPREGAYSGAGDDGRALAARAGGRLCGGVPAELPPLRRLPPRRPR